jgi:ribonuclease BN (tRNA processing enzyme)
LALLVSVAGKTVAYSGDSNWTDARVEVADEADLFTCDRHAYALTRSPTRRSTP